MRLVPYEKEENLRLFYQWKVSYILSDRGGFHDPYPRVLMYVNEAELDIGTWSAPR